MVWWEESGWRGSNTIFVSKANVFGSKLFFSRHFQSSLWCCSCIFFASFRLLYYCAELQNIPACQADGEALAHPEWGLQSEGTWVPCQRAVPAASLLVIHHLSSLYLWKRVVSLAQDVPIYYLYVFIYFLYSWRVTYSGSHCFFSFLVSHPKRLVEMLPLSFDLLHRSLVPFKLPKSSMCWSKWASGNTETGVTD